MEITLPIYTNNMGRLVLLLVIESKNMGSQCKILNVNYAYCFIFFHIIMYPNCLNLKNNSLNQFLMP